MVFKVKPRYYLFTKLRSKAHPTRPSEGSKRGSEKHEKSTLQYRVKIWRELRYYWILIKTQKPIVACDKYMMLFLIIQHLVSY